MYEYTRISNNPFDSVIEIVERKGIGHPDSVCDIVAETFSNVYSNYCIKNFGQILNHWFDKVTISGGEANIKPGSSYVTKKPTVYLFGRVTKVKNHEEFIEDLFASVVKKVFKDIFNISDEMLPNIKIDVNSSVGADHDKNFYEIDNNHNNKSELISNDTVFCNGYYGYSKLETYTIELENYINSKLFKKKFPETGFDVKVLCKRHNNSVKVTICVPFIADKINSWEEYELIKNNILNELEIFNKDYDWAECILNLNTKDSKGKGYLTVYGSALDKGDFGAVGRGNKYSGFISSNRGETQEAYHGKNPVIHSGKIFTVISHRVSRKIFNLTQKNNSVLISINNGTSLYHPESVHLSFFEQVPSEEQKREIDKIIDLEIKNINNISLEIIKSNPVLDFKNRKILNF